MTNLHFTHFSEHLLETKVRLFLTESTLFLECPVLGHQLSFLRGASRALAVSAAASEGVAPAAEDVALPARLLLGSGCGSQPLWGQKRTGNECSMGHWPQH